MDRLEYIMWRDTIRYKYQLDKSQQLSEQEVEEKIDELERTMSESMPYFFEGKDNEEIRTIVDHNMGLWSISGQFVSSYEDYSLWEDGTDTLLFCGVAGKKLINGLLKENRAKRDNSTISQEEYYNTHLILRRDSQFTRFRKCPLQTYQDIIAQLREIDYYKDIDFTNLNIVKEIFRENYIYTYKEFTKQNKYATHKVSFVLSNGQKVVLFEYEQDDEYGYNSDDENYYDE